MAADASIVPPYGVSSASSSRNPRHAFHYASSRPIDREKHARRPLVTSRRANVSPLARDLVHRRRFHDRRSPSRRLLDAPSSILARRRNHARAHVHDINPVSRRAVVFDVSRIVVASDSCDFRGVLAGSPEGFHRIFARDSRVIAISVGVTQREKCATLFREMRKRDRDRVARYLIFPSILR